MEDYDGNPFAEELPEYEEPCEDNSGIETALILWSFLMLLMLS